MEDTLTPYQKGKIEIYSRLSGELRALDVGFSNDIICRASERDCEIGISGVGKHRGFIAFGSEITISATNSRRTKSSPAEINFGSTGSFTPQDSSPYWRTIHASIILQNWELIIPIIDKYCQIMEDYYKAQ